MKTCSFAQYGRDFTVIMMGIVSLSLLNLEKMRMYGFPWGKFGQLCDLFGKQLFRA